MHLSAKHVCARLVHSDEACAAGGAAGADLFEDLQRLHLAVVGVDQ